MKISLFFAIKTLFFDYQIESYLITDAYQVAITKNCFYLRQETLSDINYHVVRGRRANTLQPHSSYLKQERFA